MSRNRRRIRWVWPMPPRTTRPSLPSRSRHSRNCRAAVRRPRSPSWKGSQLLARGDIGPAFEQFAKATSMRPEALARAHLAARNFGFAESTARQAVEKNPNQVPVLAAQVEILHAGGKDKEAREAYKALEPLARSADRDLPVFRRLETFVASLEGGGNVGKLGVPASQRVRHRRDRHRPDRPENARPPGLEPVSGRDVFAEPTPAGTHGTWPTHKGKNVLVLFFLGGKCAHCMQQLQTFGKEFEALKKLNVETVAISTDDLDAAKALKNNKDGIKFPDADPGRPQTRAFQAVPGLRRLREPAAPWHVLDRRRRETSGSSGFRPIRSLMSSSSKPRRRG